MDFSTTSIKRKNLPKFWEALKLDTCTLVDIGAREGADPRWQLLENHLRLIGFEPDPSECRRLNELVSDKGTTVLTDALYDNSQKITLNLCRNPGTSSCYRPNLSF